MNDLSDDEGATIAPRDLAGMMLLIHHVTERSKPCEPLRNLNTLWGVMFFDSGDESLMTFFLGEFEVEGVDQSFVSLTTF
ncbi:hypothetical protein [Vibrio comitans]